MFYHYLLIVGQYALNVLDDNSFDHALSEAAGKNSNRFNLCVLLFYATNEKITTQRFKSFFFLF